AKSTGNQVKIFYLDGMEIHSCKGCLRAGKDSKSPCSQKDDMDKIYAEFESADAVAFASPLYFWTITGTLKTAADRLYAELECLGYGRFPKKSVLLMTAGGGDYSQAVTWYRTYERNLGWKNLGEVLGKGKTKEAYQLGASL
ncbi:MAG: flavodoxin family protein, partial [Treponemataceae bacterium]|nr:flavodoxin family protein [Treponemataceae bacterium]